VRDIDDKNSERLAAFDEYRGLLLSVAYRMLGSFADAEDMLQETFLRFRQAPDEEIHNPRAFLLTIISRLCITHLQSARVRREEYFGQWLPEPLVAVENMDPLGLLEIDETLSMAFLLMMERLTPVERATFLLREVFEFDYSEIASLVGENEVNCRQIFRRAKQHVTTERPRFRSSPQKQQDLLKRFLQATGTGDMDGLLALLSRDVVLYADGGGKAIAVPNRIEGSGNVARGIVGAMAKIVPPNLTTTIVTVNRMPGVVSYLGGKPFSVIAIAGDDEIDAIYLVTNPDKLSHISPLTETQ